MLDLIKSVIKTLDTINVHGRDDIDAMLGCMMALESVAKMLEQPKDDEEVKQDG